MNSFVAFDESLLKYSLPVPVDEMSNDAPNANENVAVVNGHADSVDNEQLDHVLDLMFPPR